MEIHWVGLGELERGEQEKGCRMGQGRGDAELGRPGAEVYQEA